MIAASMIVVNIAFASNAASLEGVNLPDTARVNGTEVYLNGIALRTFSLMGIRIYVAGLYLEHLRDNAEQILASPEKKLLEFRFLHDVDVNNARKAWREGLERNCVLPCRLSARDVERFIDAVPPVRAGDRSTLAFGPGRLEMTLNGQTLGTITDPIFARAVLATFIGPEPPTARLKRELLGSAQ